jgi:hypothetical protein
MVVKCTFPTDLHTVAEVSMKNSNGGGSSYSYPGSLTSLALHEPTRGKPEDSAHPIVFTDVSKSHWVYHAIRSAATKGLMGGYGNGKFGPSDKLTNAQIAQIRLSAYDDGLRSNSHSKVQVGPLRI